MYTTTFSCLYKRFFLFAILASLCLSGYEAQSQEVFDRNGNGVIEESDYWSTSERYSEEYISDFNASLRNRALVYSQSVAPDVLRMTGPNPVGTCNIITCGSFDIADATPNPDWGGFRIAPDGSTYAANVAYSCWDDNGTVDYSEGQYISYSNSNANIDTPGIISQAPDGGGFAIFSFRNESIDQDLTVLPNANYTVCFEIAVIPRYSNDDGDFLEFQPNLQFGISSGGIQLPGGDPLTYTHNDLNIQPNSSFPSTLSTNTTGPFQNPGGWTDINPFWETVCITFQSNGSGTVNVFYQTGDPGRSVVLVDGLRLSLEGYAVPPTLTTNSQIFCDPTSVDLNDYVVSSGPAGSVLTWSTNVDPLVTADHLANTNVSIPTGGTFYAFYYNPVDLCSSPAAQLDLALTDLDSSITSVDVACFGDSTGSVDLTVTGGTAPYSFVWSPGGETTEDLSNVAAGTYSVVITDANGCTITDSVTVSQPTAPLDITSTAVNILCFGDSTGSIDISVTGGTAPYSYLWNTGDTTEDLSGIPAGVYNVVVTDANGCVANEGVTISEPDPISILITKENATATGGCVNGEATANPSGGVSPYTYLWSASAGGQTTQTATNLPSGTHTVTVTDANGCTLDQGVVIDCVNDCDAIISVDDVTNILCTGDNTGSATVSASSVANPTATYTFTWNTVPAQVDSGVTSSTINSLTAGVYTVSVTIDGTQCLPVEQSVTITEPATAVNVTASSTDLSGPTTNDGTATANPSGGTPPYTYVWSPGGATTQTITGLAAGTYTVTVTDANGCTAEATTTVNPGTCRGLNVTASSTPTTCNGDSDGTVSAGITGGVGPFTYLWSPGGQTTQTVSGLPAGSYTVTVTDGFTQCTAQSTTTINQPSELSSGIAITNVACFGDNTGSLDLTVTGGTAPYSFVWSPGGETTEDLFDLTVGTYSVVITDANGCTLTDSATVLQPSAPLTLDITDQTDIVCSNGTGSVTVTASGGTTPYTYSIDGGAGQGNGIFTGLTTGIHTVEVIDGNGCTESIEVTIIDSCIAIVKTGVFNDEDGDLCSDENETIRYTFTVTNQGSIGLSNISVTDPLVSPITFVSGDTNNDGVLDVTETWIYSGSYAITQANIDAGEVMNQATAQGDAPNGTTVDDLSDDSSVLEDDPTITTLCQSASIALIKVGTYDGFDVNGNCISDVGDTITYAFTVTNTGNVTLTNVTVTDPLVAVVGGPIASLAPGAVDNTTFTASYVITQADLDAGMFTNQATATGTSPNSGDVTDLSDDNSNTENDPTVTTICRNPVIAIVKTGVFNDEDGDQCSDVDETITYTFTVTNEGNVSLATITVTDPLVSPITFVSGDTDVDGELDVDETWIYTGSYNITQDDIDDGMVTNQATATGVAPDQSTVTDLSDDTSVLENDPTVTTLCQSPAIAIVKEASYDDGGDCSDPGELINYTFTVTNEGNVSLANVVVTDPLLGGVVAGPDSGDTDGDTELDVDETWIYTGS